MAEAVGLAACWSRLDNLLLEAVTAAERRFGAPGSDPFRGLHLEASGVTAGFDEPAGAPHLRISPDPPATRPTALGWLADAFALTAFDLDVVLICLAPEVDLRYERVYAYLQDDVRRRRPRVELILDLLCHSAEDKSAARSRFGPDAPLFRHGLLHVDPPEDDPHAPLLSYAPRLDPQIVDVLLGQGGIDRRLAGCCRLIAPAPRDDPRVDPATVDALAALVTTAQAGSRPLHVYLCGAAGSAKLPTATALASATAAGLLHADLSNTEPLTRRTVLPLAFREARLHGALLYLTGIDQLRDDEMAWARLLEMLARDDGITILAGSRPWPPTGDVVTGMVTVSIAAPGVARRRECWASALAQHGIQLADHDLDVLAARFRLDTAAIEDAATAARPTAALRDPAADVGLDDVLAAARDRSGHELAALATRIRPRCGWDDLVLPPDAMAQLQEVRDRARYRERVVTEWCFGKRGTAGLGTSVLFTGGSGTGKTTAAQIIAGELGLDLYTIDLARVVSKYIGETEKNLGRIFDAARDADAVLFFDEADALFGKRSEVRDSHDRYANIEVSFLLQRLEQFEGVAILATNLRQHLDEALLRRLAFSVSFPFPDAESRRRIWQVVWPDVPKAPCVDLDLLAHRFALSGGNIRNIALAASFLAAADGGVVRMDHLMHATRREYQKLGKALGPAELTVVPA